MGEDGSYRDLLESKRFDIVQNLQVQRTFVFDYLRSKGVLDGEDCELIHSEKTTSRQIGKFIDILARKGQNAYNYLLESLQLENPVLYEKLTGEKASATTSPIMTKLKLSYLGVGAPLGNGELEILSKHLERTYGDLHEMSLRLEQVVQQKKTIEERLETTFYDLERKTEKVEELEKQIDSEKRSPTSQPNHGKWLQYMDTLRKEKSDRDIYIIALQTKLLSANEGLDELQKKNESLHAKNEELHKVIKDISDSYKKKKCESLRLSERIQRQGDEIKKAEQTMRKYRECQFQNMKLREDKDRLQENLDELHKWTDALKTRFDIVEMEKQKTLTSHTEIVADFGSVQDELMTCKEEINEVQLVAAHLRERIRHLEHDRQTYKRQRDGALTARREAILDRDKAFLERDQAIKKYNELKANREAQIEDKILQLKNYDELVARSDVMEEELKQAKIKLREAERELQEVKLKCGLEEKHEETDEDAEDDAETTVPGTKPVKSNDVKAAEGSDETGNNSHLLVPTDQSGSRIESIKRRLKHPLDVCPLGIFRPPEDILLQTNPIKASTFPSSNTSFLELPINREKVSRKPIHPRRYSSGQLLGIQVGDVLEYQTVEETKTTGMKEPTGTNTQTQYSAQKLARFSRSSSEETVSSRDLKEFETELTLNQDSKQDDGDSSGSRTIVSYL